MKAIVLFNSAKRSLHSMSDVDLEGFVLFHQKDEKVKVSVYLKGLPDGPHGFHIHEKGMSGLKACSDARECCKQLGGHFTVKPAWSLKNLEGVKHGEHNGDLCFNVISENGIAEHIFEVDNISLDPNSEMNVVGRSLVIHEQADDMGHAHYEEEEKNIESYITGNAGARIACGEIRMVKM